MGRGNRLWPQGFGAAAPAVLAPAVGARANIVSPHGLARDG